MKDAPQKAAKSTTWLSKSERLEFSAWLRGELERSGKAKKLVARDALHHSSASYLNTVLAGSAFPRAYTLRAIAEAAGIPVHLALIKAGYPGETLPALAALSQLGATLCSAAGVRLDPVDGIKGAWPSDSLGAKRYGKRLKKLPPGLFEAVGLTNERDATKLSGVIVLPKSTALAIDLAILAFPRRGDTLAAIASDWQSFLELYNNVLRRQEAQYLDKLTKTELRKRNERLIFPRLLKDARSMAMARTLDVTARRAIVAELVQAWTDTVCSIYAQRERERFYSSIAGVSGSSTGESISQARLKEALKRHDYLPESVGHLTEDT